MYNTYRKALKLGKIELKLAKTARILSAWDKEFANYKGKEKAQKQTYYNRGFKDTENSTGLVIFQAQNFEFI